MKKLQMYSTTEYLENQNIIIKLSNDNEQSNYIDKNKICVFCNFDFDASQKVFFLDGINEINDWYYELALKYNKYTFDQQNNLYKFYIIENEVEIKDFIFDEDVQKEVQKDFDNPNNSYIEIYNDGKLYFRATNFLMDEQTKKSHIQIGRGKYLLQQFNQKLLNDVEESLEKLYTEYSLSNKILEFPQIFNKDNKNNYLTLDAPKEYPDERLRQHKSIERDIMKELIKEVIIENKNEEQLKKEIIVQSENNQIDFHTDIDLQKDKKENDEQKYHFTVTCNKKIKSLLITF